MVRRLSDGGGDLPGPGDIKLGKQWCLGGACPHDHDDDEEEYEDE